MMCDIMKKGSRYICGKIRTCKISGDKIIDVYDDEKRVYVPCDEFLRQQEEYKTIKEDDDEEEDPYQWYIKKVFKKSVTL